ncbi:MAG: hypothetical protein R2764_04385 [Bacteroidales bacterium]
MKNVYLTVLFLSFLLTGLIAQDTIVVQTLTFDSITTRRGVWDFPENEDFRKILMVHTLKCDPQTTHDNYDCGEWDYLTYNVIYKHTGMYDSTLYFHPSFTFANDRTADSVLLTNTPSFNYFNHKHSMVSYPDTLSYESVTVDWEDDYASEVFQTMYYSGRSQFLWKANELTDLGFSAGDITGIKMNSLLIVHDVHHLMIRMANTTLEELMPNSPVYNLDTVFYDSYDFDYYSWNDFSFLNPFIGMANPIS